MAQEVAPSLEYLPAGQSAQLVALRAYVPPLQVVHPATPAPLYAPAGHVVHALEPFTLYLPAAQLLQAVVLVEYVPAAQAVQEAAPAPDVYPDEQPRHFFWPVLP